MKAACGHAMCDLCGAKACELLGKTLRDYGTLSVCGACAIVAMRTVYEFACRWGGVAIDRNKPCGGRKK